jgi:hypothetical protein
LTSDANTFWIEEINDSFHTHGWLKLFPFGCKEGFGTIIMNDARQPSSSAASDESPLPLPSASSCFASRHVPLVYVEIVPLDLININFDAISRSSDDSSLRKSFTPTESPADRNEWISAVSRRQSSSPSPRCSFLEASVKLFLWKQTLESSLTMRKTRICIQWKGQWVVDKKKGTRGRQPSSFLRQGHLVVMNDDKHHQQSSLNVVDDAKPEHPSVIFLPQLNPTLPSTWPCVCYGYAYTHHHHHQLGDDSVDNESHHSHHRFHSSLTRISVTAATMIRILPPVCTTIVTDHQTPAATISSSSSLSISLSIESHQDDLWKEQLTGEECCQHKNHNFDDDEEVMHNHNPEAVRQMLLRIKLMLSQPIRIATTARALENHTRQGQRQRAMRLAIQDFYNKNDKSKNRGPEILLPNGGSRSRATAAATARLLLVHSQHAGSGKTLLVQACFRKVMSQCNSKNGQEADNGRIHIIRVGPLLAKYGVVYVDTALETVLHQIVLSAAVHGQDSICVILDHFDALFPAGSINSSSDAAAPALHAMTARLKALVQQLYQLQEFPFPKLNPLYNLELDPGSSNTKTTMVNNNNVGGEGCVLSIRLCLVAIVTCPDGSSSNNMSRSIGRIMHKTTILDAFGSNTRSIDRFRLPPLTAHTRWTAFDRALAQLQEPTVIQSSALREKLPFLAAAAVWARGAAFGRVAQQVQIQLRLIGSNTHDIQDKNDTNQAAVATVAIFSKALATVRQMTTTTMTASSSTGSNVQFLANDTTALQHDALFASNVGGNAQAKRALVEALSLNPKRRQLLTALGLSPPTGILLYGAPGTGKVRIIRRGS